MELNLHPMGLGELLDRSLNLYRRNFLLFLGIVAIIQVPIMLAEVVASILLLPGNLSTASPTSSALSLTVYYGITVISGLVRGVGMVIQMAALSLAASERYHERPVTLKQVYGRALRRWDTLLVLILIIGAANVGVMLVLLLPVIVSGVLGTQFGSSAVGVAAALGMLVACLAFAPAVIGPIFLNTRWAFGFSAAVLENLKATRALGRSWHLVKGYFWRVLGTLVMLGLFIYVLILVPTSLIMFAVAILSFSSFMLSTVANTVISELMTLFVTPLQFAVLTLLYYDIRIRREGYDLQVRAAAMPLSPSLPADTGANPSVA